MGVLFTVLITPIRTAFVLIAIASVSVVALTRIQADVPLDPFAPYADILSARSEDALVQRGFDCRLQRTSSFDDTCLLSLDSGAFSEIQASVVSGAVRRIVFTPREAMLPLGQLMLLWGKPEITVYGHTANLRWRDRHVIAIPQADGSHFSYRVPISYVAFDVD